MELTEALYESYYNIRTTPARKFYGSGHNVIYSRVGAGTTTHPRYFMQNEFKTGIEGFIKPLERVRDEFLGMTPRKTQNQPSRGAANSKAQLEPGPTV